ncbi:hypothetical protein CHS0354_000499 [Potamilus streckersoni]|uniref:SIS domain-containing protein n=1 Tax=Potamilus streckersoni TaxID=2493646 RepID=A0AAE0T6T8_9BIVA|nr:hypothetical protein CHS0354_000499 [Potamilus streckersoni]
MVEVVSNVCIEALSSKKKIMVAGNGGSAADAQHFAAELLGKFYINRPSLAAIALTTDTSTITATGNDFSFDLVFSRQLEGLGQEGDVFIGISTSGNAFAHRTSNLFSDRKNTLRISIMNTAIILAGGFGTRLQSVVSDVPKPMAPINGLPFLSYILNSLSFYNISKVILSVGYKHDVIQNYFGELWKNIGITYALETIPLGTGGAINLALTYTNEPQVFVLNGDTFFDINFFDLAVCHKEKHAGITVAVKEVINKGRYGSIAIQDDQKIISFSEKQNDQSGLINGGIYALDTHFYEGIKAKEGSFSLEKDVLELAVSTNLIYAFKSDGYFIDIGIPEDYLKAQVDFKSLVK